MRWNEVFKEWEVVSTTGSSILVPLDMLKHQNRIFPDPDVTYEDPNFKVHCLAAEQLIEKTCEFTLRQKVMKLHMASWPDYCDYLMIKYELPPIQSITHIKYYDEDDTQQTLSSALYENWLNRPPPCTLIKADNVPALSTERSRVIEIQVLAGHATSIPEIAQQTILELVAFWYQNKEAYGRIPGLADGAQGRIFNSLLDMMRWRLYL